MAPALGRHGAIRRHARRAVGVACLSALLAGLVPAWASAAMLPPQHPPANAPDPLAGATCVVEGDQVVSGLCGVVDGHVTWQTAALQQTVLQGIDRARVAEGLPALVLPASFAGMGVMATTLTLLNDERQARGLPPVVGVVPGLDQSAAQAAVAQTDPNPSNWPNAWGSVWGEAIDVPQVWFGWLYADGWGGSPTATENVDCTSANAPGCWSHRDVLLGDYGPRPVVGIGSVAVGGGQLSVALVLTASAGVRQVIPLGMVLGPGTAVSEPSPGGFADLGAAPWAAAAISTLQLAGVVDGLGGARFGPGLPLDEAQLATMAGRLFGWPLAPAAAPAGTPPWAAGFLGHAVAAGYLPPNLPPGAAVSRGLTVSALESMVGWPQGAPAAIQRGLLCGTGRGYDLASPLTRAQAAVLLYRAAWLSRLAAWGPRPAQYSGQTLRLADSRGDAYAAPYAGAC